VPPVVKNKAYDGKIHESQKEYDHEEILNYWKKAFMYSE
jgi:hypothetical protein